MKESVSDYLIRLHHDLRKAQKTASMKEIQDFSIRIYQASIAHEKRIAQLQAEQSRLTRYNDLVWKYFLLMLDPMWKVDEQLFPIYEELKSIYHDLESHYRNPIISSESIQTFQKKVSLTFY